MDNQDQHYGGGGARKRGPMDVRSDDVVIISDETTAAEEETVDGATSVDLALTLMTGSRNDGEDGRTLNLIESLTEAPAAVAESSGGARNNAGIIRGGEWNSAGELDFVNKGVVAVGNPGSAFTPFTRVRAQAAAVVNQSPPVQERSPPINVLQHSDRSNRTNDKKLDDGGGKNSSEVAGKSPSIITTGKAEEVGQSSSRNNAGMIWGGERNSDGMLDFINKGVVAVGNPGSAFRPFTPVRAKAAAVDQSNSKNDKKLDDGGESSDQRRGGGGGGGKNSSEVAGKSPLIITTGSETEAVGQSSSRTNAGMIWGGERNSEGMLDFVNKGVVAVGNPGSAFRPFTRERAAAAAESSGGARNNAGIIRGGERNSAGELGFVNTGKSPMIITTGKAEAVGQSSSRHNQNLAGGRYYSQTSGGGSGGGSSGRYYSQTSGGAGGSGHNPSIGSAVTIAALPPLPPRPRDGYSQTSGGSAGGSGHNSSMAGAVTIAALPPLPPRPRPLVEYVCIFCKRARFSSIVLVEEHMSTCPRRVINLG
ncbi:hypothetical protein ACP275_08G169500 [Erythranthe tilingii]